MPEKFQESPSRFAVIDIGTNTFHLLIAEPSDDDKALREIYRSRHFIKLAENGIETLSLAALERGMKALQFFRRQIDLHQIPQEKVIALGTAALRTAVNGPEFRTQVKTFTNINIQVISGDREAQLIAQGALMAIPTPLEKVLIMDIGGGSVEFIIADQQQVYWAESFPVGVAVLYRQFQHHEPISSEEIQRVHSFLTQQLKPLITALQTHRTTHLVGAAGTFDVVANRLAPHQSNRSFADIDLTQFDRFIQEIVQTTQQQRYEMPEIPNDRADMIVVALLLIDLILKAVPVQQLTVSYYAMKEGMMAELIKAKNRD